MTEETKFRKTEIKLEKVLTALNEFRKSNELCDVKVVVGTSEYPAHKVVLAAFSSFFKKFILEDGADVINLDDTIQNKIWDLILKYAYGATIGITDSNVRELLHAAHYINAAALFVACCRFLEDNINIENVTSVLTIAEVHDCTSLKTSAKKFVLKNFHGIYEKGEFLEWNSATLISILQEDSLNVEDEATVLNLVLRWFYHNEENRAAELSKVLCHVRLVHLNPSTLKTSLRENAKVRRSPSLNQIVEEVLWYHVDPDNTRMQYSVARKREVWGSSQLEDAPVGDTPVEDTASCSEELQSPGADCIDSKMEAGSEQIQVFLVYGKAGTGMEETYTEGKILCITENSQVVQEIPVPFAVKYCISSQTELLCVTPRPFRFYRYNLKGKRWTRTSSPSGLQDGGFAFAELHGVWYLLQRLQICSATIREDRVLVYCFEPHTNSWKMVSPLCDAGIMDPITAVGSNGMLYIVVCDPEHSITTVHRYDPQNDCWNHTTSSMEFSAIYLRASVLDNKIVLYAPFNSSADLQVYDPSNERWVVRRQSPHRALIEGPVTNPTTGVSLLLAADDTTHRFLRILKGPTWEDYAKFANFHPEILCGPFIVQAGIHNLSTDKIQGHVQFLQPFHHYK